jgi:intein/homing endonuclease
MKKKLNSEYWVLGFMYADGCITDSNYITINLATKDIETLKKLKDFLNIKTSIKTRQTGKYFSSSISIKSKILASYFILKGCVPRKSLILKFPTEEQVPKNFQSDFIRGYFDGDGCITYRASRNEAKINIKGTESFLSSLKNILLEINCSSCLYKQNNSNIWNLDITGYNNVIKFLNFIYNKSDSSIRIDRKFEKSLEIFNKIKNTRKIKLRKNKIYETLNLN